MIEGATWNKRKERGLPSGGYVRGILVRDTLGTLDRQKFGVAGIKS